MAEKELTIECHAKGKRRAVWRTERKKMKDDPIDELHRLNEEFAKLLNGQEKPVSEKTTVEQLVRQYGLTTKEAENWLRNEPDFVPSDGSYHDKRPDDKLPEPARATPPKP